MYQGTFGPVSNRADWSERISLLQTDSSTAPDLDEATLSFGGRCCAKVTKTLSEGDLTYSGGALSWTIDDETMRSFRAGTYDMGIVLTIAGVEEQLFAGNLDICDGVIP